MFFRGFRVAPPPAPPAAVVSVSRTEGRRVPLWRRWRWLGRRPFKVSARVATVAAAAMSTAAKGEDSSRMIDLMRGHPAERHLPYRTLQRACREVAEQPPDALSINYTERQGPAVFREALSEFLSRECKGDQGSDNLCLADNVFAVGGVSSGLELACAVFGGGPGNVVLVESPSYFLAFEIFRSFGLTVVPVPSDSEGLSVAAVEDIIGGLRKEVSSEAAPPQVSLLYMVPTHSNPTATTLPLKRRQRLVELARKHNFKILADEVYHLLDWSEVRPSRMCMLDPQYAAQDKEKKDDDGYDAIESKSSNRLASPDEGVVLSISAFTKIFCPGVRLGWIEAAPGIMKRLEKHPYVRSGGGLVPLQAQIASRILVSGEQKQHLNMLVNEYKSRVSIINEALRRHPDQLELHCPADGGYFMWLKVKEAEKFQLDTLELQKFAVENFNVNFLPGNMCHPHAKSLKGYLRICFACVEDELDLKEGISRLARAIAAFKLRNSSKL
mmetsp:Transcript_8525/g.20942  ORF Transcript_8525/g.20942 Transcript_8525/m.20942 type:complete len:498 (-) Transcript_8525:181-1674(-)